MKKLVWILLCLLVNLQAFPQQVNQSEQYPLNADSLITWLAKMQSGGGNFYDKGLFPSQRTHPVLNYHKEDNNIFFTALIVMVLQDILPYLSPTNQETAESMIRNAVGNYPKYRNKYGRPVYNFWQTNPSQHFPNDHILSTLKKFILPEDFDDTSIIFLTDNKDTVEVKWLKMEMILHTNRYRLTIHNIDEEYKNFRAYSTWFGQNMPIDFDISVLSNTMLMVYHYQQPLNKYDSASLLLIRKMLLNDEHLKDPAYISPHYKKTSVILYHLARLISQHDPALLRDQKQEIIEDIRSQLSQTESLMEYIILSTSLMKFGICPSDINKELENDIGEYNFFVANMVSTVNNRWKKILGSSNILAFPYESLAYDYALLLENIIYRRIRQCPELQLIISN